MTRKLRAPAPLRYSWTSLLLHLSSVRDARQDQKLAKCCDHRRAIGSSTIFGWYLRTFALRTMTLQVG
jgi:hypothetical protein